MWIDGVAQFNHFITKQGGTITSVPLRIELVTAGVRLFVTIPAQDPSPVLCLSRPNLCGRTRSGIALHIKEFSPGRPLDTITKVRHCLRIYSELDRNFARHVAAPHRGPNPGVPRGAHCRQAPQKLPIAQLFADILLEMCKHVAFPNFASKEWSKHGSHQVHWQRRLELPPVLCSRFWRRALPRALPGSVEVPHCVRVMLASSMGDLQRLMQAPGFRVLRRIFLYNGSDSKCQARRSLALPLGAAKANSTDGTVASHIKVLSLGDSGEGCLHRTSSIFIPLDLVYIGQA
mmetsp:Transcript_106163/g.193133  ORF Transcript_106163/g.193133 Transcript_106163/m.193133 type:complete len:289 (+) Transcript_106163:998-1864(+)